METSKSYFILLKILIFLNINGSLSAITNWELDPKNGNVEFEAIGNPSMLKIHGEGSGPTGKLVWDDKKLTADIFFELSSLDTKMDTRNDHMKNKYLEVAKFPQAQFSMTKIDLPPDFINENFKGAAISYEGLLKLHGVEKNISGKVDIEKKMQQVNVRATFSIKLSDFAIAIPDFAGITMAEEVDLIVSSQTFRN